MGDAVSSVTVPEVLPKPEVPVRLPASKVMSLIRLPLLTVKLGGVRLLVLVVPDPLVRLIGPVVAPAGTVAVTWLSFTNVKTAVTPLKLTLFVPVKLTPLIVTRVLTAPLVGENDVIDGGGGVIGTVKFCGVSALESVLPPGVVTTTNPWAGLTALTVARI